MNLFVYGSLMDPDVFELVTGTLAQSVPARVEGFARIAIVGESYPAAVVQEDNWIDGLLIRDLPLSVIADLDRFEGDEYDRVSVTALIGSEPVPAQMYLFRPELSNRLTETPWFYDRFLAEKKEQFLQLCRHTSCKGSRNHNDP